MQRAIQRLPAILTALLLAVLPACSTGTSPANSQSSEKDYPTIRVNYIRLSENTDETMVEEQLNRILRQKANAEIDLVGIEMDKWSQQMDLMLTDSADHLDLYTSFLYKPLGTLYGNGEVAALDELLRTQAPELAASFAEYTTVLDCGRVDGTLYGIPAIKAWSTPNHYVAREEDAVLAGVDWEQVHTLEDVTDAMLHMKETNPTAYYLPGASEPYWVPQNIDNLGDSSCLGVLLHPLESTTVENYYESEEFCSFLEQVALWKENGLISPNAMNNDNQPQQCLKYGITNGTFGYSWSVSEFCQEANLSQEYGGNLSGVELGDRLITSGNVTLNLWHISPLCSDPQAAMRVLNVLATDPEAANLLINGVEDVHYTLDEAGQMVPIQSENGTQTGWYTANAQYFPNSMIGYTWNFQAEDVHDQMAQSNADASPSLALGFVFDSSTVRSEMAACNKVIDQYYLPLINGEVDTSQILPQFQKALREAGIQRIIQAKQTQLDAWLEQHSATMETAASGS